MMRQWRVRVAGRLMALKRDGTMKVLISLLIGACLTAGCVAGSNVTHEDSPGAVKRDAGPALCRDGSTPPCNDRD
jgi:hypothetical protein